MQNFKTLRQSLLGDWAMSWRERGERERGEKNAIYSGHLRLCQQPRAAHALRSDQFDGAETAKIRSVNVFPSSWTELHSGRGSSDILRLNGVHYRHLKLIRVSSLYYSLGALENIGTQTPILNFLIVFGINEESHTWTLLKLFSMTLIIMKI